MAFLKLSKPKDENSTLPLTYNDGAIYLYNNEIFMDSANSREQYGITTKTKLVEDQDTVSVFDFPLIFSNKPISGDAQNPNISDEEISILNYNKSIRANLYHGRLLSKSLGLGIDTIGTIDFDESKELFSFSHGISLDQSLSSSGSVSFSNGCTITGDSIVLGESKDDIPYTNIGITASQCLLNGDQVATINSTVLASQYAGSLSAEPTIKIGASEKTFLGNTGVAWTSQEILDGDTINQPVTIDFQGESAEINLISSTQDASNMGINLSANDFALTLHPSQVKITNTDSGNYITIEPNGIILHNSRLNITTTVVTTATDQTITGVKTHAAQLLVSNTTQSTSTSTGALIVDGGIGCKGNVYGNAVYGAVFNDYAEYRKTDELKPGLCVCENGNGELSLSKERLQPGANIISDTFGFAIGETDDCKTPIAVSGRVLVYPYENKEEYQPGDAVCAGPNGTISKMTREEIREYPERIVGTVSEIPTYETWGTNKVQVDGRIWIKVR